MPSPFIHTLADRLQRPLYRLLVFDWRFTFLFVIAVITVGACAFLPFKIWTRTPPDFHPIVKVSTLDFLQAKALARTARAAEAKGDLAKASYSWGVAFANDLCNRANGLNYVRTAARLPKASERRRALLASAWLYRLYPEDLEVVEAVLDAANRNQAWDLVLEFGLKLPGERMSPETQLSLVRAFFYTGQYREALARVEAIQAERLPQLELYGQALRCIAERTPDFLAKLEAPAASCPDPIEAHEVMLTVAAAQRRLPEFEQVLARLKRMTDQTVAHELFHARLLGELGQRDAARKIIAALPNPKNAAETTQMATSLVALGQEQEAAELLQKFCPAYPENDGGWLMYAGLLVKQRDLERLRLVSTQLKLTPTTPVSRAIIAAIDLATRPSDAAATKLSIALSELPGQSGADAVLSFAADAAMLAGAPAKACELLLVLEPSQIRNPDFYHRLFAAADAARDMPLMRRSAQRRYDLAPDDLVAAANLAAILILLEQETPRALAITERCLQLLPHSVPAKINHAAALLNAGLIGSADITLASIDDSDQPDNVKNQILFLKIRRALQAGDRSEADRLSSALNIKALYPPQIAWLENQTSPEGESPWESPPAL